MLTSALVSKINYVTLNCDVKMRKSKHFGRRRTCDYQNLKKRKVITVGEETDTYPVFDGSAFLLTF
jgi:hypothetical protein